MKIDGVLTKAELGGFARLKTVVDKLRADDPCGRHQGRNRISQQYRHHRQRRLSGLPEKAGKGVEPHRKAGHHHAR